MDRTILHVDANSFFASVECAVHPELRDKPMAVAGDSEKRHGIILAANYIAKRGYGIKTAETIYKAKRRCPELVTVKPHMELYRRFSERMREILLSYSDYVEPFGCDECWVELKGILGAAGVETAERIRKRIKAELGITVSIGVSFNKVFAKLGSDMKKPDAVTVITRDNFKEKIWNLPVEALLYVGERTRRKLAGCAVYTIGDLARTDEALIKTWLGKNGMMLRMYASGDDTSPVERYDTVRQVKSVGNSTTCPRDLTDESEVRTVLMLLAESVAERLRDGGRKGSEITVSVRDSELKWASHGKSIDMSTDISSEIYTCAFALFKEMYKWKKPIRGLGICVGRLTDRKSPEQLDIFGDAERRLRSETIERTADSLKKRFGRKVIRRARLLNYPELSGTDRAAECMLHVGDAG